MPRLDLACVGLSTVIKSNALNREESERKIERELKGEREGETCNLHLFAHIEIAQTLDDNFS